MRATADRKLPEPYRSWIDRAAPLPAGVQVLPRTVTAGLDSLVFLALAVPMGAMGAFFASLAARVRPDTDGWGPLLLLASVAAGLWILPLIVLRRAFRTIRARVDQKRGVLRQGVLIGPEGILVRLEPNRGHAIPADRFVVARLFPPERSKDTRVRTVVVETQDGEVKFFASRFGSHPERINQAVSEIWPQWRRPKPLMRANRQRREDRSRTRAVTRSVLLLVGSIVFFFALVTGLALVGVTMSTPGVRVAVWAGLLLVAGSIANMTFRFLTMKLFYRCPQCGARPPQVPEALPALRYYCAACNVEWDTGLSQRNANDD